MVHGNIKSSYWCWKNIGAGKISELEKYRSWKNIGAGKKSELEIPGEDGKEGREDGNQESDSDPDHLVSACLQLTGDGWLGSGRTLGEVVGSSVQEFKFK